MTPREIDALIAEKVMGLKRPRMEDFPDIKTREEFESFMYRAKVWTGGAFMSERLSLYSEDIEAAWEVVEKLGLESTVDIAWLHTIQKWAVDLLDVGGSSYYAQAESAPMAICLAALKAKGVEI